MLMKATQVDEVASMHSSVLYSTFEAHTCLTPEPESTAHPIVCHFACHLMHSATSANLHIERQHIPFDSEEFALPQIDSQLVEPVDLGTHAVT